MRKMIFAVVVTVALAGAEVAMADSIVGDTAEALYQRAAASETNFADPQGYLRQSPIQGAGGDGAAAGAAGDGGAGAGAGASGGNGGGSTGGDGCSR